MENSADMKSTITLFDRKKSQLQTTVFLHVTTINYAAPAPSAAAPPGPAASPRHSAVGWPGAAAPALLPPAAWPRGSEETLGLQKLWPKATESRSPSWGLQGQLPLTP